MKRKSLRWLRSVCGVMIVVAMGMLLTACGPEMAVEWSADGRHAFVSGEKGIFVDESGTVMGTPLKEDETFLGWMPDSKRMLVQRKVQAKSWAEFAGLLGEDRTAQIAFFADQLEMLLKEYRGDWGRFREDGRTTLWSGCLSDRHVDEEVVAYYLEQTRAGALAPVFEAAAKAEAEGREDRSGLLFNKKPEPPPVFELLLRKGKEGGEDELLLRSADGIVRAGAASHGKAIAFGRAVGGGYALEVLEISPGAQPVQIEADVKDAAWSPDGTMLAFVKPFSSSGSGGDCPLVTIETVKVCAADGTLLPQEEKSTTRAMLMGSSSVAWLPDGRLFFTGKTMQLPAAAEVMEEKTEPTSLFAVRTTSPATIETLVPGAKLVGLPDQTYVLSPDGKKVALADSSGAVAVVFLESGRVEQVQAEIPNLRGNRNYSALTPTWRNAEELCYVAPAGEAAASPERGEVVVWKIGGERRTLSREWKGERFLPPRGEEK